MYRYIIIDDEEIIRKGTLEKLSPMGDAVCCAGEASDGEEGLSLIERQKPDIAITDMKMPVMGGDMLLPILCERYPDMPIIVISGYEDFEYSRQAIRAKAVDYILKPFSADDIIKAMKEAVSKLKNAADIKDLGRSSEEYRQTLCFLDDKNRLYGLIKRTAHDAPEMSSSRLSAMCRLKFYVFVLIYSGALINEQIVSRFLADCNTDSHAVYLPSPSEENIGFLIVFRPPSVEGPLRPILKDVLKLLRTQLLEEDTPLLFGMSGEHASILELHDAYLESVSALNGLKIKNDSGILAFDGRDAAPRSLLWDRTDELLFYIEAGDPSMARQITDELFSWYESFEDVTLYEVKYSLVQIDSSVKYMLNKSAGNIDDDPVDGGVQDIMSCIFHMGELKSRHCRFFSSAANIMAPQELYSDSDIAKNVKTYIDRNYVRNINVEFAASVFHVNRSYLSHIFKKKTGTSFVDYLNRVRIDNAKRLIRCSDKKFYNIAKQVGYDNVSYFWKIFKKMEKVTPEQYRRSAKD